MSQISHAEVEHTKEVKKKSSFQIPPSESMAHESEENRLQIDYFVISFAVVGTIRHSMNVGNGEYFALLWFTNSLLPLAS